MAHDPNILKTEKKVAVISMLCEGSSIRTIKRITGIHDDIAQVQVAVSQLHNCGFIQFLSATK